MFEESFAYLALGGPGAGGRLRGAAACAAPAAVRGVALTGLPCIAPLDPLLPYVLGLTPPLILYLPPSRMDMGGLLVALRAADDAAPDTEPKKPEERAELGVSDARGRDEVGMGGTLFSRMVCMGVVWVWEGGEGRGSPLGRCNTAQHSTTQHTRANTLHMCCTCKPS